jgi:hypothetical protein
MIEECIRCGAIEVELSGYDEDRSYSDEAPPR